MKANNVHYEILGQRGTTWTILAVADDQDEAIAKAREVQASYRAVKVMRERFDTASNTYRAGQIFFSGAQAKPSKYNSEEVPSVCWKVEDFYSYEGRRAINRLLRAELVEWGITATELIHSLDHIEKLQDNGTSLQRAVQQTAIAQIRETGQGVQERIKQIYELIDKGVKILRRDAPAFPEIGPDGLDGVIARVRDQESRAFLLHAALVRHLMSATSYAEKMTRLLGMLRTDHPAWVHEVADSFVAELLSLGRVIHLLVGERNNLKEELAAAASLLIGRANPDDALYTAEARMVSRLIAAGKLPNTQQSLTRYLIENLKSKKRLVDGDVAQESAAVRELVGTLKKPDSSWIGEVPMMEAAGQRCARWLHPEAVSEYLAPADTPDGKADLLLQLEGKIVGNANRRKLAEFLVPIIISPQGELFLTREGGSVTERLIRLRALQVQVLHSTLQDMHRRKLAEKLDDYACKVIRNAKLIERVTSGDGPIVEKCFRLLRMLVENYFTLGKATVLVRDAIRRCLATPDFVSDFLASTPSKQEKLVKLEALQKLLRQAGIDDMEPGGPAPTPEAESEGEAGEADAESAAAAGD